MGIIYTKPVTIEQKQKIKQKKEAKIEQERKNDQDLINAYLLQELASLKKTVNNNAE